MDAKVAVPADIAGLHPSLFALEVDGNCMAPTINPGDFVVVADGAHTILDGKEMVALEIDGIMYLCRPLRIMGQVVMFCDNPQYPNATVKEDQVKVIGPIVHVASDEIIEGQLAI